MRLREVIRSFVRLAFYWLLADSDNFGAKMASKLVSLVATMSKYDLEH